MGTAIKEKIVRISVKEVPTDKFKITEFLKSHFGESVHVAIACTPKGNLSLSIPIGNTDRNIETNVFSFLCDHGSQNRPIQPLNSHDLEFKGGEYVLREGLRYPNLLILLE